MISKICKNINIPHATPHTFRRCYATHLHDDKESLLLIKHTMGHSNLKMTERYIRMKPETL